MTPNSFPGGKRDPEDKDIISVTSFLSQIICAVGK
jgi:hypothetical protein